MSVSRISKRLSNLGEGPIWDVNSQMLYYVDAFVGDVCRLDTTTGETEAVTLDGTVSLVIPYKNNPNKLLVTLGKEVRKLDFKHGTSELVQVVEPENLKSRFNDGKCDANGRLWAGTLIENEEKGGHLYRLDSSYEFQSFSDDISLSNGITWSLDFRTLFFIDSMERRIYSFDFDLDAGTARNKRTLVDFNRAEGYGDLGFPDGMTTDNEGKLWVACYDGGCVIRIDPDTGHILCKIDIPAKKTTSCCFGGPNFDVLYITTAQWGLSTQEMEKEPNAGAIFAVTDLGVHGQAPFHFAAE